MFVSTQIDKIKRNAQKYKYTELSNLKSIESITKPLYCIILLLFIIFVFFIYYIFNNKNAAYKSFESSTETEFTKFSQNVTNLYDKLLEQLNIVQITPSESMKDTIPIPENKLYRRTKAVQSLFDYVQAATRELHANKYVSNPSYHHVRCMEAFSPGIQYDISYNKMQKAVEKFISSNSENLYSSYFKSYVERVTVTNENHGGLLKVIGQYGIIAKQDIKKDECIGHYYGDEYLLAEYEEQFNWEIFGSKDNHPFKKKWDYYMTIPYDSLADKRLKLEGLNVTVTLDSYHMYNYEDYIKDGGLDLSDQLGRQKQNWEPLVNDARASLYKSKLSALDRKRKNSEFVYCAIDGIIQTMFIIHADIKRGQQLFVYYGPHYGV